MPLLGTLTLPGEQPLVAIARTFVRDLLPEGLPVVEDIVVVADELISNAILHTDSGKSGGIVTVTLEERRSMFLLEVTDDGSSHGREPGICPPSEVAEGGRGLWIVDLLALRWGVLHCDGHTIVWAEFAR